ncbi:hypothetical protein OF820_12125 [Oceanotoga sp. DSM 15011]|jgi:SMC interacting uncharacterized protein involved in chromosome segregation|uniref:Uncharacterized protein n=1 Tax=Oceanotoga teriensis TaxID=515440 RepID=A0AA45HIA3_9BACT|nr:MULTISPECIES: hypothetical protein [Oceanotoga]MDN5341797.1 hypothetical protein [Oceanotoga sp.]MDO7975710.1 hypothetical protein [Oceanotoga teriensis]PWJ90542.1 hypothetical protein C7380_11210 [Oceanotoga teriensis]UYO99786.1 hypothetical protein OF820_12125 [Oceanotoga sp. DSM 15011]
MNTIRKITDIERIEEKLNSYLKKPLKNTKDYYLTLAQKFLMENKPELAEKVKKELIKKEKNQKNSPEKIFEKQKQIDLNIKNKSLNNSEKEKIIQKIENLNIPSNSMENIIEIKNLFADESFREIIHYLKEFDAKKLKDIKYFDFTDILYKTDKETAYKFINKYKKFFKRPPIYRGVKYD